MEIERNTKSFSMSYAKDILVAMINKGQGLNLTADTLGYEETILKILNKIYKSIEKMY